MNTGIRLIALGILSAYFSVVYSHGGGLNSQGCHNQNSDSTYHCHSGAYDGQSFSSEQAFFDFINSSGGGSGSGSEETGGNDVNSTYDRDDYLPGWADADGDCISTRHEVLILESQVPVTLSSNGCSVVSGSWLDLLTGITFTDPSDVDIDHHVPLSEAHDSGGLFWTKSQKQAYANDLLMAEALVAVDDGTNSSKGARDPGEWLPPNAAYHCSYVKNWVEVKERYGLSYDSVEQAAIEDILGTSISLGSRSVLEGMSTVTGSAAGLFGMGIRRGGQCGYATSGSINEALEISLSITPTLAHASQSIEIILVAAVGSDLFIIDGTGNLIPFTGAGSELVPFIGPTVYQQSTSFTLFDGMLSSATAFDLFVAYRTSQGELVFTASPFSVIVN
ncbi:MAG: hypothetical protein COA78_14520 [Blastopirellula sp.]|nr:MAG: hypothetical protein COA78_14520 [Blastopirellula sp.]